MRGGDIAGGFLSLLLLGGCAGGSNPFTDAGSTATAAPEFTRPGRWMLSAPNAPSCGMSFTGAPGATTGKVTPDGGCPDKFFTSRNWAMDGTAMVITDAESNNLATLSFANGRFEGQSAAGTPISLSR
jgi:hypothetical protein